MAKRDDSQLNLILSSKAHAFSVASLISPQDGDEESLQRYAYPSPDAGRNRISRTIVDIHNKT